MSEVPDWAIGTGVDTDMSGDPRPGSQRGLRFWMPKASDKTIIFLTDGNEALGIWEHQFRMGGKYTNWLTCVEPIRVKCKMCEWAMTHDGDFARGKVLVFTVIDCDKFTGKDGKERENVKKLLCAKARTAEHLKRKYETQLEEGRGLKGAMFKVYRGNDTTSASVGTDFEYKKHVELSTLLDAEPLDVAKILAPDPDAITAAVRRLAAEAGDSSSADDGTDAKVDY